MTVMTQRLRQWLVPVCIGLQIISLAVWWEWFNTFAFGTGTLGGGIVKFFLLSGFFAFWAFKLPGIMERKFGCDRETYLEKDALAGLPLAGLLLIIPFAKSLGPAAKIFTFQLFGYVWMPWWMKSYVISSEAKLVLVVAGIFILGAMVLKIRVLLQTLYQSAFEKISVKRLFWFGFLIYIMLLSWPACTQAPQAGEISHWLVTQSLALDGAFHVDGVLGRADYYQFYPLQKIIYRGYTDSLGRLFLPVAPGMPLLYITFFLMQGRWLLAVLAMLFAAGAASQLFGFCREQDFSHKTSFWVWLVTLFSAPLMLYGYQQTEVTAGAFFLIFALRNIFRIRKQSPSESMTSASIAALAAGLMLLGGIRFLIPALFLILFLACQLFVKKRMVQLLIAGLVLLVPLAFTGWYYAVIYKFFLTHMPYKFYWPWELSGWLNLMAVFFDRYAGMVWHAPIWIVGLAGTFWMAKTRGIFLSAIVFFSFITGLITAMIFPDAWGEGSSFHRFVAPMTPLLGLGLAAFLEAIGSSAIWRKRLYWISMWGVGIVLLQTVFPFFATEAVRLRLGLHFQPLGWIYGVLPSFKGRVIMLEMLVGAILMIALGYAVFRLVGCLKKLRQDTFIPQPDEKPKPRIV